MNKKIVLKTILNYIYHFLLINSFNLIVTAFSWLFIPALFGHSLNTIGEEWLSPFINQIALLSFILSCALYLPGISFALGHKLYLIVARPIIKKPWVQAMWQWLATLPFLLPLLAYTHLSKIIPNPDIPNSNPIDFYIAIAIWMTFCSGLSAAIFCLRNFKRQQIV